MAANSKIRNFGYSIAIVGIVIFQHSNSDFTKLRVPDTLVHVVPSNETFQSQASTFSTARCHCVFIVALVRAIFYTTLTANVHGTDATLERMQGTDDAELEIIVNIVLNVTLN